MEANETKQTLRDPVQHVIADGMELPGIETVATQRLPTHNDCGNTRRC